MRPVPSASPPALCALAATVLLAGCGTHSAGSGAAGGSAAPSCVPSPTADRPTGADHDGVSLVSRECGPSPDADRAAFRVTNPGSEALTYEITFTYLNASGQVMDAVRQTVASVGPGQSVTRAVERTAGATGTGAGTGTGTGTQVRITKVRAVPAAEAPAPPGTCPPSGVRVTADDGDAAMGLRVVGLHLTNCGAAAYRLDGYPALQLLDASRKPLTGVDVLRGTAEIATGIGRDAPAAPLTLRPGESASASLAWRNTTGSGDAVTAPYARVTAKPGAPAVTVTPELDLGTTGRLGVGAWEKDRARTP
ncbi:MULTISPECIES: DUF4232 domain-containing protein [unclassified Streptomyces]|uniref:DUF4232 domain-containing protein n=1 Tax=unclassified Streptomyces TaxID=2593676 RepID=UPI00109E9758|nr:DUF4232 domain-containing protein [Streptomyces sp. A1136]THA46918.1 DUF4232 domain-containing protein [Streptomyces sp. A1136]